MFPSGQKHEATKVHRGQNQNALKDAAGVLPFPGEHARGRGCPLPLCPHALCSLGRGATEVEVGAEFGGGIGEPFPSMRDRRAPPVFLELGPGAAWQGGQSSALTRRCATGQAGAQGAGKTFASGIGPQPCRLRCSYGLCHPV